MKFDAGNYHSHPIELKDQGNETVKVTNQMIIIDGKPAIPVMGEMHFSRIPAEYWHTELQKMKAGGVDVVASYVFWIHHEEKKGEFTFSGNCNIRHFAELCLSNGMQFCLRIGPWAHGECRNGGFPDWLCEECQGCLRTLQQPYIGYVKNFIDRIAEQLKGIPLFAIQIENEYRQGASYLEKIRQMVLDAGLHAPLLTATAWGGAKLPSTLLPMFGGYPEEPWLRYLLPSPYNVNYFFSYDREGGTIGADLLGGEAENALQYNGKYPFLTCEVGGGNQVTYHRRPMFVSKDIETLAICKLGSGVSLLGYYMYHGGQNPIGETTMQESRQTRYPNDYPIISYDFQAPIGDCGQLRESYFRLKKIHEFIHAYGDIMAPMEMVLPDELPQGFADTTTIRAAFRTDGYGGFLFVNNHIRLEKRPSYENVCFHFTLKDRDIDMSLTVPSDSCFVIPVGLTIAGLEIDYATAFPLSRDAQSLTLMRVEGMEPILCLRDGRKIALKPQQIIDGVTVNLEEPVRYIPTALYPIAVEKTDNTISAEQMLSHLPLDDQTVEYRVKWDRKCQYLVIQAKGNLGAFYADGRMISDFYFYGLGDKTESWVVDVRKIESHEGIIKIQPLTEQDIKGIYWETKAEWGVFTPEVYASDEDVLCI